MAEKTLETAFERRSEKLQVMLKSACNAFHAGDRPDAIELFSAVFDRDPDCDGARRTLAQPRVSHRVYDRAIPLIEDGLKRRPDDRQRTNAPNASAVCRYRFAESAWLVSGNYFVKKTVANFSEIANATASRVFIRHFDYRSVDQLERKALNILEMIESNALQLGAPRWSNLARRCARGGRGEMR